MSASPHLRIDNVTVSREGREVLRGLEMSVHSGTFVAVEGRSGVGKSSLLACLAGTLAPADGSITYRCRAGCEHTPDRFRTMMGCVFQNLMLTANATAETNVLCGLLGQRPTWRTLFGFSRADRQQARELLALLDLEALAEKPVYRLSGGERQRVAVARALIARPACLIADEPVSQLNPDLARSVLALLKQECTRSGCMVICALHDAGLAREFSDLRLHLRGGDDWQISGGADA